jgi:hypothetical protein
MNEVAMRVLSTWLHGQKNVQQMESESLLSLGQKMQIKSQKNDDCKKKLL